MGARRLTRWQKASALVPMAVLVAAWGAALGNSGLATASDRGTAREIPAVPATAFEQPASVQQTPAAVEQPPAGVDPKASTVGVVSTLATNGIPDAALAAYRRAEILLGRADKSCHLPWNLVAGIGRVESNHGRTNGNSLTRGGLATPGIFGIPLDGKDGRARITDTDGGTLDKDAVLDLAVGPMQFIPGTWQSVGVDSDVDGTKNPQDIDDAAAAAGIYLCAGEGDLSDPADAAAAVKRYNHSDSYVQLVLKISAAYAQGDFTQSPNDLSAAPILTSNSSDQPLTPAHKKAAQAEKAAKNKTTAKAGTKKKPTGGSGDESRADGGTHTRTKDGSGSGDVKTPADDGTTGGGTPDPVVETPPPPVTDPVKEVLSEAEANRRCLLEFPLGLPQDQFDTCVYDLTDPDRPVPTTGTPTAPAIPATPAAPATPATPAAPAPTTPTR